MDSIDAAFNIFVYCKINREIDILKYGLEMAKRLEVYKNT